ncbi:Zinc-type alcohol dehydrogenase-like protein [Mycolicibacterium vanbaalenii]|uniref:Zinc-type alcohol dehydrogenase-like protein n=1 Tax=Mycolicibacterium vanbaalenii TaxID=110539 RepID=A0A5S9R4P0_MYCVN|nr:NADP-dependent oxidoreductase [Mycolicibacterium vanbaalenii]CAA0127922.1 Zinc-type alcohol dehydrogenase-like protein [Mycolicibacterium vanbaalenii]
MKRIQYHQYGGPEVMRLEDFEPASPGPGEVSVRVRAAAANPLDWKIRRGEMKLVTGRKFPQAVGHDFSGVIEAVGPGVTLFTVGDHVFGGSQIKTGGAFAEVVVASETGIAKKPAELSFEEASAIPTIGLAALQALVTKGKLQAGQAVFVHGCLGGVGRAAVQIASERGAASVGGSCRISGFPDAGDLGVDPIVEFDSIPTTLTGQFDIVFDTVGTLAPATARMLLKSGGRIVDIVPSAAKFIKSFLPGPYNVLIAHHDAADLAELAQACAKGTLRLPIAQTVPLSDAIAALTELECHHTPKGGKLIITTG